MLDRLGTDELAGILRVALFETLATAPPRAPVVVAVAGRDACVGRVLEKADLAAITDAVHGLRGPRDAHAVATRRRDGIVVGIRVDGVLWVELRRRDGTTETLLGARERMIAAAAGLCLPPPDAPSVVVDPEPTPPAHPVAPPDRTAPASMPPVAAAPRPPAPRPPIVRRRSRASGTGGLRRIPSPPGWQGVLPRGGKTRYFSDAKHGGSDGAKAAAAAWVDAAIAAGGRRRR